MVNYETRLVAELRARNADEHVIADARASLKDFPASEAALLSEFGEPEQYAQALTPGSNPKRGYALALVGLFLTLIAWAALKWAGETDWEPIASWGPLAPLLSLVFIPLGVIAEGWRHQRRGRS